MREEIKIYLKLYIAVTCVLFFSFMAGVTAAIHLFGDIV